EGGKTGAITFDHIANGFDWNAFYSYETRMTALKTEKALRDIGEWEWQKGLDIEAFVTFDPAAVPGQQPLARVSYRSPLAPGGATLYMYRRPPPAAALSPNVARGNQDRVLR